MADYIKRPDLIKICAHLNDRSGHETKSTKDCNGVCLTFVVECADGRYHKLNWYEKDGVMHYVRIADAINPTFDKLVDSPEEVTEFFSTIKPTDEPSVAMHITASYYNTVYWNKVTPKGTIRTIRRSRGSVCGRDSVFIPLPEDRTLVEDGSDRYDGSLYWSQVYWNVADAMKVIWDKTIILLDRIRLFCEQAKAVEDRELATGAATISKLLAFQEQSKSVEERIATTWNAMSTEDKAKALKITTPKKATSKKNAKK